MGHPPISKKLLPTAERSLYSFFEGAEICLQWPHPSRRQCNIAEAFSAFEETVSCPRQGSTAQPQLMESLM